MASPDAALAKARALLAAGRADEAVRELQTAIAHAPDNPDSWCLLGMAEMARRRPADALRCADEALARDPDNEWAYRLRSTAYGKLGEWQHAAQAAREAVRLAPNLAVTHGQLAVALAHGDWPSRKQSIAAADRAIELAPHDADIHYMAGTAALTIRNPVLARRHLRRTLELRPDHAGALNNLSVAELSGDRLLGAAAGFGSAAALDPANDLYRYNLDVTTAGFLRVAKFILLAAALLVGQSSWFGLAALLLPVAGGVLVLRARATLPAATWQYLKRSPLRNSGVLIQTLCLTLVTGVLIAGAFVPGADLGGVVGLAVVGLGASLFLGNAFPIVRPRT